MPLGTTTDYGLRDHVTTDMTGKTKDEQAGDRGVISHIDPVVRGLLSRGQELYR